MWDVGGQDRIRPLWRHYFTNTQGLIFVVDSNDRYSFLTHFLVSISNVMKSNRERIEEAKDELMKLLNESELDTAALIVLANKQDLPGAVPISELTEKLQLYSVKNRKWFVQGCSATQGMGIYEGLDWLSKAIYP